MASTRATGSPCIGSVGIIPPIARVAAASRAAHVPIFASKFTVYTSPGGEPLGLDHVVKARPFLRTEGFRLDDPGRALDRKSTRLNSSHGYISYAVFCL